MEVNNGGSTVLPDCMSSVMPRWFSVISPMRSGNIGNVPLVMIAALCRDKSNPFGDTEKCSQDGNAYISFGQWGQWVGAIVLYTYVFHMLAPPPGGYDAGDEDLTLKSPTRGSPRALITSYDSPERLPLLTEEATPTYSSSNKKQKITDFLNIFMKN